MDFVVIGNVYDALAYHNGSKWTTYDRDNDLRSSSNCAASFKGAWWYRYCYQTNLNGILLKPGESEANTNCRWYNIKDITFSEMKVQ